MPRAFIAILLEPRGARRGDRRGGAPAPAEPGGGLGSARQSPPHAALPGRADRRAPGGRPGGAGDDRRRRRALHAGIAWPRRVSGLERPRILWVGIARALLAARGLQARLESEAGGRCASARGPALAPASHRREGVRRPALAPEITPALRQALAQAGTRPVARACSSRVDLLDEKRPRTPRRRPHTELASRAAGLPHWLIVMRGGCYAL